MDSKQKKKWVEAGKNAAILMEYARGIIKEGMPLLEIAEKIETKAREMKAQLAFPVNLACDEIAAHYSPVHEDKTIAKGLLKIDLGVSIDGCISDIASSVDLTKEKKHKKMIEANEKALNEAIKIARAGISINEIGKVIHRIISEAGFAPVRNLCGHEIDEYNLHAGMTIPNYDNGNKTQLKEGQIIAIEPFATTGEGVVQDGRGSDIYMLKEPKPVRDKNAREILEFIVENYNTLPFAERWLIQKFGIKAKLALKFLEQNDSIHHFSELVEKSRQPVSQAEHTLIITEKGCEILTKQ